MPIKNVCSCLLFFCLFACLANAQNVPIEVNMQKVKLHFSLADGGKPTYSVSFNNKAVIAASTLGFVLQDDSLFYKDFQLLGTEQSTFNENWKPVWEK